jgi:hypothetical protein
VTSFRLAAIAAVAAIVSTSTFADTPLWRVTKGDYSEYKIFADPRIVGDPRLAFVLEAKLGDAQKEVDDWEAFARDAIREKTYSSPREDTEETLRLLGTTDRYAAILTASASCSGTCHSGEFVTIYRFSGQQPLKPTDVLEFNSQIALLNHLVERDQNLRIGPYATNCEQLHEDSDSLGEVECVSLGEMLDRVVSSNWADDHQGRFKTRSDIKRFLDNITAGFTTDGGGRLATLDIYFSYAQKFPAHAQAFRWSIDAKVAAPFLKPALRDLAPL